VLLGVKVIGASALRGYGNPLRNVRGPLSHLATLNRGPGYHRTDIEIDKLTDAPQQRRALDHARQPIPLATATWPKRRACAWAIHKTSFVTFGDRSDTDL
jgi:hypothetical protein